jgi:hypothetical protein
MKMSICCKSIVMVTAMLLTNTAFAVKPGEEEDKQQCKKPKFRDFDPAANAEVLPETEVVFHVSRGAELHSITVDAKGEKLPVNVQNRVAFILVKSKLPANLREGFARIHVTAKAEDGGCMGQDGWLIKIKSEDSKVEKP